MAESSLGFSLAPSYFPYQRRTDAQKTEDFFKKCIDAGISLVNWNGGIFDSVGTRSARRQKITNYNLYADIVDKNEIERVTNPFRLSDVYFPNVYRNYPLLNSNIQLLLGEERRRAFNPIVTVINEDIINLKQDELKKQLQGTLLNYIANKKDDPTQLKQDLLKLDRWAKYTYRDSREVMASQVLEYLQRTQMVKETFSRGFENLLISAEEIYVCEILGGEPVIRNGNPLNFYTLRSGESWKLEDSDIIVEDAYVPVGEVIDRYYEHLTTEHIKKIEEGHAVNTGAKNGGMFRDQLTNMPINIDGYIQQVGFGSILTVNAKGSSFFGGTFDQEGNVRVIRCVWRGMRKIGIVKYFDENYDLQEKVVPETYVPDTAHGEQVDWQWISEWYEGTRIADDIYVKMQPRAVQMRHMDNLSVGHPGIVGTIFNTNSSKGRSMMDMGRDWQYLFNAFMYKLEQLYMKSKGKVGMLPLHLLPDGWTIDKILYYTEMLGWMPYDAFNEGNKGASTGKLGGSMNTQSTAIDLSFTQDIQSTFLMLNFIKSQVDDLTGISPQRKGAIDNRETKGGVEMAVTQSSLSTEKWFSVHDNTRIRALKAWLETAKVAWRDKKFKRNYFLDDGSMAVLDFNGPEFLESEYGIDISSSADDAQVMNSMKNLAGMYVQKGGKLSIASDLYRTKDPAKLQRKLETIEEEQELQIQKQQEAEQQAQQAAIQQKAEAEQAALASKEDLENKKLELEQYKADLDASTKITIAEMTSKKEEVNGMTEKEVAELAIKQQNNDSIAFREHMNWNHKDRELASRQAMEEKKLNFKEKELQVKKEIAKSKPKPSTKSK